MKKYLRYRWNRLCRKVSDAATRCQIWIARHWHKPVLVCAALYLVSVKDITIGIGLEEIQPPAKAAATLGDALATPLPTSYTAEEPAIRPLNTSMLAPATPAPATDRPPAPKQTAAPPANTFSNLTARNDTEAARAEKRRRQLAYAKSHAPIARDEMKRYGIPASIKLAQGLLESNVGESTLAKRNHNHFGIKCFSRTCAKGHCSNFTDDSHKDFFRVFPTAKESFRAHSLLLKHNKRYAQLFRLPRTDYAAWAKGLKAAGYATDPQYAEKIIGLIEELDLHEYD